MPSKSSSGAVQPSQHMRIQAAGFSLTEILLAVIVIALGVTAFASIQAQGARSLSSSQLGTYAADALDAAAQQINQGNPVYATNRNLSEEDLYLLANQEGRRQNIKPALRGTISAVASDPPTYLISVQSSTFTMSAKATAPGGSP